MSKLLTLPFSRVTDANGNPLSGALLYAYLTDTTTLTPTYTTSALDVEHENPIEADANGLLPAIYLDPAITYRFKAKTAAGADIAGMDWDPVTVPGSGQATFATTAALQGVSLARAAELGYVYLAEAGKEGVFRWISGDQSAEVASDPYGGIWKAPSAAPTGGSGAWQRVFDGIQVHAAWFGASGANKTAELQAAFDYALRAYERPVEQLIIGDVSAETITIDQQDAITQFHLEIAGEWTCTEDNAPVIAVAGTYFWGWRISGGGQVTYSTAGNATTKTARAFLDFGVGSAGASFYLCTIEDLTLRRMHYAFNADAGGDMFVWGCVFDCEYFEMTGGIIRAKGTAGQPHNTFLGYWRSPDAIGPLFDTSSFFARVDMEMNDLNQGPVLISDSSGCFYILDRLDTESGTYATAGRKLFDTANGRLVFTSDFAFRGMTVSAATTMFHPGAGDVQVMGRLWIGIALGGTLTINGSGKVVIEDIVTLSLTEPLGANLKLTDTGGTTAADATVVKAWNADGNPLYHTATYTSPAADVKRHYFPGPIAADVKFILPADTNLFSGLRREVYLLDGSGAGNVLIRNSVDTATLFTIAAGAAGKKKLEWNRSLTGGPFKTWVAEP